MKRFGMVLLALLFLVQILAIMPPVQTYVAQRLASSFSLKTGADIRIEKVGIRFFSSLYIDDLYVSDVSKDTLLYVDDLSLNLLDFGLRDSLYFNIGTVRLDSGALFLDFSGESPNYQFILDAFGTSSGAKKSSASVSFEQIQLCEMDVRVITSNSPELKEGFDARRIEARDFDVWIQSIDISGDKVAGVLRDLSFVERSGFVIEYMQTDFEMSSTFMTLDNTWIELPNSEIGIHGRLDYNSFADFSSFMEQVDMDVSFFETRLTGKDFVAFHPTLIKGQLPVYLTGEVSGTVSDLQTSDVDIAFGSYTNISGDLSFVGLPNWDSTYIQFQLENMMTHREDIDFLYADHSKEQLLNEQLDLMGLIEFEGALVGFPSNFKSHGLFRSDIGSIQCDIQLTIPQSEAPIQYSGSVKTPGFEFGKLLRSDDLGMVALNLELDGRGATMEELDAEMKGEVARIDLFGYQYKDISVNGQLTNRQFEGTLAVADSNIALDFNGLVDMSEEVYKFRFSSNIERVRPAYLNWGINDSSSVYSGRLVVNFQGNSIDNIIGRINLSNLDLVSNDLTAHLNEAEVVAFASGGGKTIALESDNARAQVTGLFDMKSLSNYIRFIEHQLFPSLDIVEHDIPEDHHIEISAEVKDSSPLLLFYAPGVESFESISLEAQANYRDTSVVVDLRIPIMVAFGNRADSIVLSLNTKGHESDNSLRIKTLATADTLLLTEYVMNFSALNDSIEVDMNWKGKKRDVEKGHLAFYFAFDEFGSKAVLRDGRFELNSQEWKVFPDNFIEQRDSSLIFQNVGIYNREQSIRLTGLLEGKEEDSLNMSFENFDLRTISPFTEVFNLSLAGVVDGNIEAENPSESMLVRGQLSIDSLELNNVLIGSGAVKNEWNNQNKRLDIEAYLEADDVKTIQLTGSYFPVATEDQLNLVLNLERVDLSLLQPIIGEYVKPIRGEAKSKISITGMMKAPQLNGVIELVECSAHVDYLNNTVSVKNQKIFIEPDFIYADAIEVNDRYNNRLYANFSLFHEQFSKFSYDCFLWTDSRSRFMAMNTTSDQNELYYGQAFLEPQSTIGLSGSYATSTYIEIDAEVGEKTNLSIPINDDKNYVEESYIIFVTNDSGEISLSGSDLASEIIGLDLKMKIRPTEEATVKLVFDEAAGDIITAHGTGNINLALSPSGEFDITGSYNITRGDYLFTFQNLLNKRFVLENGGSITWDGDPYKGMSDIDAVYRARASLYDLGVVGYTADTNALKQRINVDLVMHMSGAYTNPNIDFSFRLPDTYDSYQSLLNGLDDGEKNKEAFTLLLLGKFVPIEGMGGASVANNVIGSNTMEVLSNQLSNWLSKISDDFDVGFTYKPGDDLSSQEVAVALSTQLFNDRVSVETNLGYQENAAFQNQGQFIGDFEVEYAISADGRVKAKVFNRSNIQDPLYENYSPYTQGMGVAYREDFETFHHLGCRIRRRFLSKEEREKIDCDALERERQSQRSVERNEKLNN